jgi:ABC-type dipeptide/oligopeptide/nickel transport system permease component
MGIGPCVSSIPLKCDLNSCIQIVIGSLFCFLICLYNQLKFNPCDFNMNNIETVRLENPGKRRRWLTEFQWIGQRIGNIVITLLVIAYLAFLGLLLAQRGREHSPAQPINAVWQSAIELVGYFSHHPATYYWNKETVPAFEFIRIVLARSAGLLLVSMAVAAILGIPLGIIAALSKRKISSALIFSISILGISTPSFLLAMLFWIVNIYVHKTFDMKVLPSAGFGWDAHLIMPALVLAMRPMAQVAQITYVSLTDALRQDYVRTAQAKGLMRKDVLFRHALRNILIPIFTTLGISLRFSLASLPVVELFFGWPGVGSILFDAINQGEIPLVVDLLLSLGLFFLFVNLALEVLFPLLDARIADRNREERREDGRSFKSWWLKVVELFRSWRIGIVRSRWKAQEGLPVLPAFENKKNLSEEIPTYQAHRRWIFRNIITNPSLVIGFMIVMGLVSLVIFGHNFASANPYQTNNVMMIDGKINAAPFKPSTAFPWGSDYIGRDVQALVLFGAKQTLSLAFFGMIARLVVGTFLGALAGWQQRGWLDRLVTGAVGVWAAFPVTLFAMILIQALGIQQGVWVFVVSVCVVGWGEIAQFVRGQVIAIKPQLYIESARSVGLRSDQIMVRHVVPNLINGLVAFAALEMGGVLMLLAELGYLNIFLGGGFQAVIGEAGRMQPIMVNYSDVPEWASMIANIRQWWRSYPWMVTYPGIAFFISIFAFNLTGEGLRRFLDESHANLSRLFNRYTFSAAIALSVVLALVLRSASPMSLYRPDAQKFSPQNVQRDIQALSAWDMEGRETGTLGAERAAEYIAQRMQEVGLIPAGEHGKYFQNQVNPRLHLSQLPVLNLLNSEGGVEKSFKYRTDFAEIAMPLAYGENEGQVMGLAFGPQMGPEGVGDPYGLANTDAVDRVVIVRASDLQSVNLNAVRGALVVADDESALQRKDVYPYEGSAFRSRGSKPVMVITPELADMLLTTAGSNLDTLNSIATSIAPGKVSLTKPGATVHMALLPEMAEDITAEKYINVLGVYPGEGVVQGLDSQVIIVSAYYDGLGTGPDGVVYPGANDNASGVAMMLEMARLLKQSVYKPDKTILFVAWAGGERSERLSVTSVMNARPGGLDLTVEEVMELSGVGYGSGNSIAISEDSSYRMVRLFQSAAAKIGAPTTTRGRDPHYGHEIGFQFGARTAITLSVSWDGSDQLAHTTADTPEIIDNTKLYDIGATSTLVLFVLSRETNY